MDAVSDGGRLALDLYDLLRETDPARWREDLEARARDRLARIRARTAELLHVAAKQNDPLSDPVKHVATVLDDHGPPPDLTGHDLRAAWMRFRERMVPAYEALARVLRARRVSAPTLRPTNWYRSAFHVVAAFGVILLFEYLLNDFTAILAAGGFAATCWLLETGRALSGRMNARLMEVRFFQLIIHPHEHHRINSATWYATALIVLVLVSPPYASVAGVAVLGAGDPLAAFVGRRWGRTTLIDGRTLEGTLAFVLFGALSAFVILALWHPIAPWPSLAVVALGASLVGAIVELLSFRLDDNFTIPLGAAAAAVGTAALLGL